MQPMWFRTLPDHLVFGLLLILDSSWSYLLCFGKQWYGKRLSLYPIIWPPTSPYGYGHVAFCPTFSSYLCAQLRVFTYLFVCYCLLQTFPLKLSSRRSMTEEIGFRNLQCHKYCQRYSNICSYTITIISTRTHTHTHIILYRPTTSIHSLWTIVQVSTMQLKMGHFDNHIRRQCASTRLGYFELSPVVNRIHNTNRLKIDTAKLFNTPTWQTWLTVSETFC